MDRAQAGQGGAAIVTVSEQALRSGTTIERGYCGVCVRGWRARTP